MIEVPAAVWLAAQLVQVCDFLSVGTNDLIQYTLAVDRNNARVAQFFEPVHPSVLRSIAHVARIGADAGKPVSICGEMAGDVGMTPLLVGLGVTSLSMIPSSIPDVKEVIRALRYDEARALADRVLQASTVEEIKKLLDMKVTPSTPR